MRKLSNKGWGMTTLIAFICIMLLIILGIFFLAYNYGVEKDSPNRIDEEENGVIITP